MIDMRRQKVFEYVSEEPAPAAAPAPVTNIVFPVFQNILRKTIGQAPLQGGKDDVRMQHVGGKRMWKLSGCMGVVAVIGRSELALSASGATIA